MIPEIGVMVGAYILARLAPPGRVRKSLTIVALLVAVVVVTDLAFQGLSLSDVKQEPEEVASSDPPPVSVDAQVTRANGGSIQTVLGYGFVVAKESSLEREFIAVHHTAMPTQLEGTPGVVTVYQSGGRYGASEYRYKAQFALRATQPLRAVEVRFLVFDVWGNHVRSLSYTDVADVAAESVKKHVGEWQVFSENEVEEHYASVVYVARARLQDGRVIVANDAPVIAEAKKFSEKFTAADLEPKPAQRPGV